MECEECGASLSEYPTIIEWADSKMNVHQFCSDDCCAQYLYDSSGAIEVDNPDYKGKDNNEA